MSKLKILVLLLVISAVVSQSDYQRIKRGKYSSYPSRFYSRPPSSHPVRGIFSYTPPPFMSDDSSHPSRPYKVSKRPTTDGLGDDDINSIMKHLSKEDLNRLIEFASEKDKNNSPNYNSKSYDGNRHVYSGYVETKDEKPFEMEFKEINQLLNFVTEATNSNVHNAPEFRNPINNVRYNPIPNRERSKEEFATETYEEENLPLPVNMRIEDFDGSYTNNVPTVVKTGSYEVENFGDLPLMDYNDSKLHTVSSYHVPHYTITHSKAPLSSPNSVTFASSSSSSSSLLRPSPASAHIQTPVYEPAPPVSAAREQSDAHLKATKIWSHKSKGAAYTLHDDGTLSPERPDRPKYG